MSVTTADAIANSDVHAGVVMRATRTSPGCIWPKSCGPANTRAGAVIVPGTRPLAGPFAAEHGLAVSVALLVKDRDTGTDARVALEEALR